MYHNDCCWRLCVCNSNRRSFSSLEQYIWQRCLCNVIVDRCGLIVAALRQSKYRVSNDAYLTEIVCIIKLLCQGPSVAIIPIEDPNNDYLNISCKTKKYMKNRNAAKITTKSTLKIITII